MARFRERIGVITPHFEPQIDTLDDETRVDMWNMVYKIFSIFSDKHSQREMENWKHYQQQLWESTFKFHLDKFLAAQLRGEVKQTIISGDAYFALEVFEEVISRTSILDASLPEKLSEPVNDLLARNLVGYRYVAKELIPVTDSEEVNAVNKAATSSTLAAPAREHLETAIRLLSDRESQDHAKVISESIHAVEAEAFAKTGERVLSKALPKLRRDGMPFHPQLIKAWENMYNWTSDSGSRHANHDQTKFQKDLAIYMLVSASAFLNYLDSVQIESLNS